MGNEEYKSRESIDQLKLINKWMDVLVVLADGMAAEVGVAIENVMLLALCQPIMGESSPPPLDEMDWASTSIDELELSLGLCLLY